MKPIEASAEEITNSIFTQIERRTDEDKIIDTINENVGLIDFTKKFGMLKETLLISALINNLEKVAFRFIELAKIIRGINLDVDYKNEIGEYALLLACKKKLIRVSLGLLGLGSKMCDPDAESFTPLMYAAVDVNMYPVVESILKSNACNIDYTNESEENALRLSLMVGNPKVSKLLLDYYLKNNPNSEVFLQMVKEICENPDVINDIKEIYPGPQNEDFIKRICGTIVQAQAQLVNPVIENNDNDIQVGKNAPASMESEFLKEASEIPIAHGEMIPGDTGFNAEDPHERGVSLPKRLGGKSKKRKGRQTRKNKKKVTRKNKRKKR